MYKIFTYGTLQDKKIQKSLFGRTLNGTIDTIMGFDKKEVKLGKNTYPMLLINPKSTKKIKGTCYTLTQQEMDICDEYEGEEYKRTLITLHSRSKAWVYISH